MEDNIREMEIKSIKAGWSAGDIERAKQGEVCTAITYMLFKAWYSYSQEIRAKYLMQAANIASQPPDALRVNDSATVQTDLMVAQVRSIDLYNRVNMFIYHSLCDVLSETLLCVISARRESQARDGVVPGAE